MKKMTCKQMGGPCDFEMMADSAEEMMRMGGEHVNEMATSGDMGHMEAKKMMDEAMTYEVKKEEWNSKFMTDYEMLPEMM